MPKIEIDTDSFHTAMATVAQAFRLANPTIGSYKAVLTDGTTVTLRFPKKKAGGRR